jgi:catechol 2,3-dioxygenase-like lactoylglutathione lyase family enzyme
MRKLMVSATLGLLMPLFANADGIPGLRGPDHFGLTVPDLQQAITFFTEVIGCKAYTTIGPFKADDDWMEVHLGVPARTEIPKLTMIRCGYGTNIELFDYRPPQQNTAYPGNADIGGHHIGFLVDDIDAAVAYLKSKGVKVQGEPTKMTQGPTAGETWVYFMAPWGTQLELTYYPKGLAYEKSVTGQVLWNPAKPDK